MRRSALLGLVLGAWLPAPATAEPFIITSGSFITSPDPTRGGTLDVSGTGGWAFHVNWLANGRIDARTTCGSDLGGGAPCDPGTLVSPGASYSIVDVPFLGSTDLAATGSVTLNGTSYGVFPFTAFTGDLRFEGEPFVLPPAATVDGVVEVSSPFVFTGTLSGYDIFRRDPLMIFSTQLQGYGLARLSFQPFPSGRLTLQSATYEFTDPIPEPATLALVASGLAVVMRTRRRREQRRRVWSC